MKLVAQKFFNDQKLLAEYDCVETAPSDPADPSPAPDAPGAVTSSSLQLPPLKMLASPDSSDSEDGSDVPSVSVPSQNRVTSQVLTNWGLHQRAHGAPLSERCTALRSLHSKQQFPAVDDDKDNSILQNNIPDGGDGSRTLKWSPAAWLSCLSSPNRHGTVMHFTGAEWQAWFCQYLGVPVPSLQALNRRRCVCACRRGVVYDGHGDHINTCQKHSGNWQRAHNHILAALQTEFRAAGFTARTTGIPRVTIGEGKQIVGDLEVINANLGGPWARSLIVDVSVVHDFVGNTVDVSRHGSLRYEHPDRGLDLRAAKKVDKYREGYMAVDHRRAFVPAIVSTSGRIHSELLRVLYILADTRTTKFFRDIGDTDFSDDAFKWRRGEFFWHIRANIGLACAQAAAMRTQVAGLSVRKPARAPPSANCRVAFPPRF